MDGIHELRLGNWPRSFARQRVLTAPLVRIGDNPDSRIRSGLIKSRAMTAQPLTSSEPIQRIDGLERVQPRRQPIDTWPRWSVRVLRIAASVWLMGFVWLSTAWMVPGWSTNRDGTYLVTSPESWTALWTSGLAWLTILGSLIAVGITAGSWQVRVWCWLSAASGVLVTALLSVHW